VTSLEGEDAAEFSDPPHDDPNPNDPNRDDVDHTEPDDTASENSTAADDPGYRRFDCTTTDAGELAKAVEAARAAVERGECIVLPTDTVYGIGADAFSAEAVQRLLDAKIRGRDMPPPVLIADPSLIRVLAVDVPQQAKDVVERHWPGPLTVICKAQPSLRLDLGEAEGTIALRVPDHALAREVLRGTGPMAVSSANISGIPAALSCDEAVDQLGDRVAVYLDGGRLGGGNAAPSTIVDFSQSDAGEVLRHGALSVELLRETLPDLEDLVEADPVDESVATSSESGTGEGADDHGGSTDGDVPAGTPAEPERLTEPGGDFSGPDTHARSGSHALTPAVAESDPEGPDHEQPSDEHSAPRRQSDPED